MFYTIELTLSAKPLGNGRTGFMSPQALAEIRGDRDAAPQMQAIVDQFRRPTKRAHRYFVLFLRPIGGGNAIVYTNDHAYQKWLDDTMREAGETPLRSSTATIH